MLNFVLIAYCKEHNNLIVEVCKSAMEFKLSLAFLALAPCNYHTIGTTIGTN